MGTYLSTGIIMKITSKLPLKEAIKQKAFGSNYEELDTGIFKEFVDTEKEIYEYYPKYFNLTELLDTKLKFLGDYCRDKREYEEEKANIEEFFKKQNIISSKQLFDEIDDYGRRGMALDKEGTYLGFTVYKLRLSLDGKMYMEGYGDFIAFLEKLIKERYNNEYSQYIKVDLS